jgi:hypothetical protein
LRYQGHFHNNVSLINYLVGAEEHGKTNEIKEKKTKKKKNKGNSNEEDSVPVVGPAKETKGKLSNFITVIEVFLQKFDCKNFHFEQILSNFCIAKNFPY